MDNAVINNGTTYAMAITPHPADIEFGIGGTVARWVKEGKRVVYVVCTNGDKGSSDPNMKPAKLAKIRQKEQLKAANILGVKDVIFLDHPDLGLKDTSAFRKEILRLILKYRPEIVATCDPHYSKYFSSPDHRVLGRLVMDVVWPTALAPNTYPDLLEEGLKLHKVQKLLLWQTAEPNYRVDITDVYELKMQAVNCMQSQIGPPGNPEFLPMLVNLSREAAKGEKYTYGEAFHQLDVLQRL
jgi:LmbE family N-acetylglucosaminyl deacetylase